MRASTQPNGLIHASWYSTVIKQFPTKGAPSAKFWKTAFENVNDIQNYFNIPENEIFLEHLDIVKQHMSQDCQVITSPVINSDARDVPLPLPSPKSHPSRRTALPCGTIQRDADDVVETAHKVNTSAQVGSSVEEPEPIHTKPQTPLLTVDTCTQIQPIHHSKPFDRDQDRRNNPMSSCNINRPADSDDENNQF